MYFVIMQLVVATRASNAARTPVRAKFAVETVSTVLLMALGDQTIAS